MTKWFQCLLETNRVPKARTVEWLPERFARLKSPIRFKGDSRVWVVIEVWGWVSDERHKVIAQLSREALAEI